MNMIVATVTTSTGTTSREFTCVEAAEKWVDSNADAVEAEISAKVAAPAAAKIVPMRFGRSGSVVHAGLLGSSAPVCGTYTRPGSGWAAPGEQITCAKCKKFS
jgi:hypothetical protein